MDEEIIPVIETEEGSSSDTDVPGLDDGTASPSATPFSKRCDNVKEELFDIEERIRRELQFIGLLESDDAQSTEKDEIAMELRHVQNEYRSLIRINQRRKSIIYDAACELAAFQEFNLVLDELNRQVEQAYTKRFVRFFSRTDFSRN